MLEENDLNPSKSLLYAEAYSRYILYVMMIVRRKFVFVWGKKRCFVVLITTYRHQLFVWLVLCFSLWTFIVSLRMIFYLLYSALLFF